LRVKSGKLPTERKTSALSRKKIFGRRSEWLAKARFGELGAMLLSGSPADFRKLVADETEKWGKVVKLSRAKVE